jgi:hypothetical protein
MKEKESSKSEERRRRDAAFSIDVGLGIEEKISFLISRKDGLYAIGLDKIIRINLPDDFDPQLIHEGAPVTKTLFLAQGSRNPLVARTILQVEDLSNFVGSDTRQSSIRDIAWEVMMSLVGLDRIIRRINNAIDIKKQEILPDYEKYTTGFSPPPVPIIDDLEVEFRSAALIANHAVNTISELFSTFFEQDFKRGRFDKILSWSMKRFGADDLLPAMLKRDHIWIECWSEIRNAIEHPREDYFLRINNFRLMPDRQIQLPTWQLKHPKFSDLFKPQQLLETIETHRNNILGFFENIFILLLEKTLNLKTPISIIDIDENDRNPDCPKRYEIGLGASVKKT